MSKTLVIGCGYLGREIARRLYAGGWEVTAWTRTCESAAREGQAGFRVSPVDIADLDWVRRMGVRDGAPDWVIHCASSAGGDVENYRQVYLQGVQNIIRGLTFGRLLYTGSTSVYGQTDGRTVDEESPAGPGTQTGEVLVETENAVLARGGIVARLSGIYGPGRSAMLRRFRSGQATMDDDGSRWLNTIHRDDAASAVVHLIQMNAEGGIYNVSDHGGITQRAAYSFLAAELGTSLPPSATPDISRKRGWTNKWVANAKLRATGWQPAYPTLLEGLRSALAEAV